MAGPLTNPSEKADVSKPEQQENATLTSIASSSQQLENPSFTSIASPSSQLGNPSFTSIASPSSQLGNPALINLASPLQEENPSPFPIASPSQQFENPSFITIASPSPLQQTSPFITIASPSPLQENSPFITFASPSPQPENSPFITIASPSPQQANSPFITIASPSPEQENSPFITIASPSPLQENSPFINIASPSPQQANSPFITIASPSPQQESPPLITIASPSQQSESPTSSSSTAPSQQQNPEPITLKPVKRPYILQFKTQVEALKSTIAALVDKQLNPEGFGTITMSASGFDITVGNSVAYVMCRMFLESDALIDYKYLVSNPRISKGASVRAIFQNLAAVHNKEIVTVVYPNTSDQLLFHFGDGDDPTSRFSVELSEPGDELEMFPNYWFNNSYEGLVPVREKNRMIKDMRSLLKNKIPPEVSVAIHTFDLKGSIAVGDNIRKHEELQADSRTSNNYARFYWNYAEALEKAAALEESKFYVKIIEEPLSCVMMRFECPIGSLLFLTNAGSFVIAGSKKQPKNEDISESESS